jgi:asparagine synthase (glutamine-hydrolysing)
MRRLSIIDLSSGKQYKNDDGSIVIVFNGEIYNYKQLKVNLENRGVFKTKSDKVILRCMKPMVLSHFQCLMECSLSVFMIKK